MKNKNNKTILKNRIQTIQELLKIHDVVRLEREVALLMLDVLAALEVKAISLEEADKLFTDISYRIGPEVEKKTS